MDKFLSKKERDMVNKQKEKILRESEKNENKDSLYNKYLATGPKNEDFDGYPSNDFRHLADTPETRKWKQQWRENHEKGIHGMFKNIYKPVNEEKYKYTPEQAGGLSNLQCDEFKTAFQMWDREGQAQIPTKYIKSLFKWGEKEMFKNSMFKDRKPKQVFTEREHEEIA